MSMEEQQDEKNIATGFSFDNTNDRITSFIENDRENDDRTTTTTAHSVLHDRLADLDVMLAQSGKIQQRIQYLRLTEHTTRQFILQDAYPTLIAVCAAEDCQTTTTAATATSSIARNRSKKSDDAAGGGAAGADDFSFASQDAVVGHMKPVMDALRQQSLRFHESSGASTMLRD